MDYIQQINRAIQYIEEHLSSELIIDQISKEAGISKWHFQRVFKATVGLTIKEYTEQRRLSQSALCLLTEKKTILEIALAFDFDSHEVFTRAFKRVFHQTPSEFRAQNNLSKIPLRPKITLEYLIHLYQGVSMEPKIISLPSFIMKGLSSPIHHVNSPHFSSNPQIVTELWNQLRQKAQINSYQKGSLIDEELIYFAGVIVDKEDELSELEARTIDAGNYAEFIHKGAMSSLDHTMNHIYGSWFPRSGQKRREAPDLCLHTEKTNPLSPENEVRILVPLI